MLVRIRFGACAELNSKIAKVILDALVSIVKALDHVLV